jgi:hypothetical protein
LDIQLAIAAERASVDGMVVENRFCEQGHVMILNLGEQNLAAREYRILLLDFSKCYSS